MKQQNSNQNVKIKKMVVFIKTFDYYHNKYKTLKEFETGI